MSATKNSPAFSEMMEQARRDDDLLDQRYAEELYLNGKKGAMPPKEKPEPKEDIFGLMGRIFNPNK